MRSPIRKKSVPTFRDRGGKRSNTRNKAGGPSEGGGKIRKEQCPGNKEQVLSSEAIKSPQKFKINEPNITKVPTKQKTTNSP